MSNTLGLRPRWPEKDFAMNEECRTHHAPGPSIRPSHAHADVTVFAEFNGVCLRAWRDSDVDAYAQLVDDRRVMRYIGAGQVRNRQVAKAEVEGFTQEIRQQGWSRFAVSLGENGPFVGYVGFARIGDEIDFGGRSLFQYWGSDVPAVAMCLALEYGFQTVRFGEIFAKINARNLSAIHITQKFFGVQARESVETEFGPHVKIRLTRDQFLSGNRAKTNRDYLARYEYRQRKSR